MAITAKKRLEIYKRDNYRCIGCGSRNRLTLDHILPIDKGGTDDLDNLQTMCFYCNQEKGNHVRKWWHRFLPFVDWRSYTKLRTELMGAMTSKDMLLEKRLDRRITDIEPKVKDYIAEALKLSKNSDTLSSTGLKNSVEAYHKRSEERDKWLLNCIRLLAGRVKELEDEKSNPGR